MRSAFISLAVIISLAGDSFIVSAQNPLPALFSCKANEVFSNCDSHPCQNTCAEPNRISRCTYVPACYPGCICKPGFVRNQQGECALVNTCGPNEVPTLCKDFYPPTCASITSTGPPPPAMVQPACQLGCNCAEGYVRDHNNVCVAANQCQCPDLNAEIVSCPNQCPGGTCQSPSFAQCASTFKMYGCQCKAGYVKDANGKCILLSQCNAKCKGLNEISTPCVDNCQATCDSITTRTAPNLCGSSTPCVEGCECLPGYVRLVSGGNCVLATSCDCNDPNAIIVANPNPCPGGTCASPLFTSCADPRPPFGCQCIDGYVIGAGGKCIPYAQCPVVCKRNFETQTLCADPCHATCDSITKGTTPSPCLPFVTCAVGCDCIPGYVRDTLGDCVAISTCVSKCPGLYEMPALCPDPCPVTCASITIGPSALTCKATTPCAVGCDCIPGYVRITHTGGCVPATSCGCGTDNKKVVASPNPCPGGDCNSPLFTSCLTPRLPFGCQCEDGYVKQGVECIPYSKCPACGLNEKPTLCKNTCEPTCASVISPPATTCIPSLTCTVGCDCIPGYARDGIKGCVPATSCVCTDINAKVVANPSPCTGGDCTAPLFASCPTPPLPFGCQCKDGYVKQGAACIPYSQCIVAACGVNEMPTLCKNTCEPTCDSLINPPTTICTPSLTCTVGCDCSPGYFRDGSGCVPMTDCAGRCPGPNEMPALCVNFCPETCQSIITGIGVACATPDTCGNGCDCIPGYVRQISDGYCMPIAICLPGACGKANEIAVQCKNSNPETCTSITTDQSLIPNVSPCTIGCDCIPGYVRDGSNDCVPVTSCDCPNANEVVMLRPFPCVGGGQCGATTFATCPSTSPVVFGCTCKPNYTKTSSSDPICKPISSC